MFALATGTTISHNYGTWYGPLFSLSFLDVYLYVCSGYWHNYFLQPGQTVWATFWSIFPWCKCLYMFALATGTTIQWHNCSVYCSLMSMCLDCSGYWHSYFLQPRQTVQSAVQSIFTWCLFSVVTDTTIYDSLGRQYGPLFGLFFLDVNASLCLHWLLAQLFPATMVSGMGHCSVPWCLCSWIAEATGTTISCSLVRQYGPSFLDVHASLCLQWLLAQQFPAAWARVWVNLSSFDVYRSTHPLLFSHHLPCLNWPDGFHWKVFRRRVTAPPM
jgi:hypothetical protein